MGSRSFQQRLQQQHHAKNNVVSWYESLKHQRHPTGNSSITLTSIPVIASRRRLVEESSTILRKVKSGSGSVTRICPFLSVYFYTLVILFVMILHYGFLHFLYIPRYYYYDSGSPSQDWLARVPLVPFHPSSGIIRNLPPPPQPAAAPKKVSAAANSLPQSRPKSHLLLNVPFYVYEQLYWLDEGIVVNVNHNKNHDNNDNNNSSVTVQYWVENVQEIKHTDDYWFAKAAMIHPQRTLDPSKAKLFIIPTLLNVIVDLVQVHHGNHSLCFQQKCNLELMAQVDAFLANSVWFQRNQGRDHVMVASHWASEWYVARDAYPHLPTVHLIGWENRNWNVPATTTRTTIMPKLCVGRPCPQHTTANNKTEDFAMIASMHPERPMFDSRSNICDWMMMKTTKTKNYQPSSGSSLLRNQQHDTDTSTWLSSSSSNVHIHYTMRACGPGPQCPALATARFGFHVPGDTYGSNRLIDTILSGTVPIFTFPQQYNVLPDWIDWSSLSYFANVSSNHRDGFQKDIQAILADTTNNGGEGYREKLENVTLNQDLLDWKTIIPFDTYLYMLSVHLFPELEWARRQTQNVSSPYPALILPRLMSEYNAYDDKTHKQQNDTNGPEIMTKSRPSWQRPVIFRAFDYEYKNVYCGGTNGYTRTCSECQYHNGRRRNNGSSSSRREIWKQALSDYYWTPNLLGNLAWWKWETDPRACGGSCLWTGTTCVHRSKVIL